jgi:hypothetical protein
LAGVRRVGPRRLHSLAPEAPPLGARQHACVFVFRLSSHGPYRVVIVARGVVVHDAESPTPPGRLRHL